jgi:hypothetical protein
MPVLTVREDTILDADPECCMAPDQSMRFRECTDSAGASVRNC